MNFTYALRISPDKKFGNKKSDGSFNGMIGELEKQNADMGMSIYRIIAIIRRTSV